MVFNRNPKSYGCYARHANGKKSETESGQKAPPPPPEEPFFNGKFAPKKMRNIPILDQWAEIAIGENGKAVTRLVPSNEGLIDEGHKMWPAPELVFRRFHFVDGVPPEYYWAVSSPERRAAGGMGTQRMSVKTWLETIEREKARSDGHIGPCRKPLPRPPEHGGCDCPVCTALAKKQANSA